MKTRITKFDDAAPGRWVDDLVRGADMYGYSFDRVKEMPAAQAILAAPPVSQVAVVKALVDYIVRVERDDRRPTNFAPLYLMWAHLLKRKLPFTEEDLLTSVLKIAGLKVFYSLPYVPPLLRTMEGHVKQHGLSSAVKHALSRLAETLGRFRGPDHSRLRTRILELVDPGQLSLLDPGEAWSDRALSDLEKMSANEREAWTSLLSHCEDSFGGAPSKSWLNEAAARVAKIGGDAFSRRLCEWLPLVDEARETLSDEHQHRGGAGAHMITEGNSNALKGLAWCTTLKEDLALVRALGDLAVSAYRKIPGVGPRAVKIGNACVSALGATPGMNAAGQLALLKVKVKFGTAQKLIEKSLTAAAAREGLPRDEIEELAVPTYGLDGAGKRSEKLGEVVATLSLDAGGRVELEYARGGRPLKSLPPDIRSTFGEEVAELNSAVKDLRKMIPAQRERIDRLYLEKKSWPLATWRERYLDHPLLQSLCRRLIWTFRDGSSTRDGIFRDGGFVTSQDKPIGTSGPATTVELWHPIDKSPDEVIAWRRWLVLHEVQQPFKQAHREVYLLTDAERATRVYSNRFAAHIVKQHQFNALALGRGWRNTLKLLVDADFPPATIQLPKWNLRAEYWTDGVGTEYGSDTNETGTFLHLATDQVRFYPLESRVATAHATGTRHQPPPEALPVESIPPLVFSEVMRDVDLFVGVASVGNDPRWSDGGPAGRHLDYWQTYSFGELTASATTRKEVLAALLPRLKIASQCSLAERFLVVKGKIRTYKIHLGSGNILMEPNDQYLCIVANRGGTAIGRDRVYLPFEGDSVLSIILSKALMLAEDTRITDPTIVSQLKK